MERIFKYSDFKQGGFYSPYPPGVGAHRPTRQNYQRHRKIPEDVFDRSSPTGNHFSIQVNWPKKAESGIE